MLSSNTKYGKSLFCTSYKSSWQMATGQLRLNHELKSRSLLKGDEFTTIWQQQNLSAPICKSEEISPAVHNQCFYTQFTAITLAQHFSKGFASKFTGLWQQSVFKSKLPTVVSVPVPRNYSLVWLSYLGGNPFYFLLTGNSSWPVLPL